jgi:hypothetical protein
VTTFCEPQVTRTPTGFAMTVTISAGGSYWTSLPTTLTATSWDAARKEAFRQVSALISAFRGDGQEDASPAGQEHDT